MSIANELSRLLQAKSDLATSIANKGVTVPSSATLDDYPALVDSIQQGGTPVLPYDAEVEWIGVRQGAWTEPSDYIPTGNGISIEMVARFIRYTSTSNYPSWFAARTGASYLSYRFIKDNSNTKFIANCANTDSYGKGLTFNISANNLVHIHLDNVYCTFSWVNSVVVGGALNTNHTGTANTNGFIIGDNVSTRGVELNVYSFTVRNYGTVMLDYVPVRVGQVGYFYDRIGKKLYGKNAKATADLVVGNDKA